MAVSARHSVHVAPASPHYQPSEPIAVDAQLGTRSSRGRTTPRAIASVGATLLVAGAFLPWTKITVGFVTLQASGVAAGNRDGWVTLACAAVVLFAMCLGRSTVRGAVAALAGGVAAWVGISDLIDIRSRGDVLTSGSAVIDAHAVVGLGLWMTVAGAVIVIVAAVASLVERTSD